jgi:hypothetical protein
MEYWVSVHHSSTPSLQYSNHFGWSEAIERTLRHTAQGNRLIGEAYESFSAAC